jgi:membrane dipeptidase
MMLVRWLGLTIIFCWALPAQESAKVPDAEVERIHRSLLLIDTHNDRPYMMTQVQDGKPETVHHSDAAMLRKGGVGAVFFAAYVPAEYATQKGASAQLALRLIGLIKNDIIAAHPDTFVFATSAAEIEKVHKSGKIAALIGIEGGHAIEDDPDLVGKFAAAGVRYMTLTHTNTNDWADSSGDPDKPAVPRHNGLTPLGKQVIEAMNRAGMMVDISHVSDRTFWDALETSKAPVFASHSSCRAVANHSRNMTDDMIRALARKGGVIQINFNCDFVSQKYLDAKRAGVKEPPPATLAEVVEQIDHAVKVGGIDAVGIGSDFDGIECAPAGLENVTRFPNLTRALLERGYTEEQLRKIYGGNTLRLMRQVEATAAAWRGKR